MNELVMFKSVNHVVDADIRGFFDNVSHEHLLDCLQIRIKDRSLLHLIGKFLKAGYVDSGLLVETEQGTPQGSILTPRTQKVAILGYAVSCNNNANEFIIAGDPNRETVISGSFTNGFEASTWTPVAGWPGVYSHPWTFDYVLLYGSDSFSDSAAIRKELLFVNERRLNQVALDLYTYSGSAFVYQGVAPSGLGVLDSDWTYCVSDQSSVPAQYKDKIFMRLPTGYPFLMTNSFLNLRSNSCNKQKRVV